MIPPKATGEPIDRHPLAPALIVGAIAVTGAVTFVGSLAMWLLFRDTGVNWLFQAR